MWLNQSPIEKNAPEDISAKSNYPASTDNAAKTPDAQNYNIMDNIVDSNKNSTPESISEPEITTPSEESANDGYYLVKEVDGIIKVFYYDEQGKETLVRETDIAFSLLSTSDQSLFQKGIIKHSTEELDELLQDFES